MGEDFDDLDDRIKAFRESREKRSNAKNSASLNLSSNSKDDRAGIHAGIEFVASIIVPSLIGFGLDRWLGTNPLFFLILFFLGLFTGFYNVYRLTVEQQKTPPEKTVLNKDDSRLHNDKKDGNKITQNNEHVNKTDHKQKQKS